ncbi:MAG TPA: phospho-N-acetylmuramoyl-pentapeptide-transferase [Planctomycetes bacterium]|nr:phospho-N-acetylmuramoyl-pentapeptide-transferase [Planctomycetota bacterium]
MLYALLHDGLGVGLFGYISFRVAMAALTGFGFALLFGGPTIRWLHAHSVKESAHKSDSPELAKEAVAEGKDKTPTMGGSFLVAALLASVLLWARLDVLHVVLGILLVAGLAAVGFVDDFKKLTIAGCKGLGEGSKMLGLTVVTLGALGALAWYAKISGRADLLNLYPPFFKNAVVPLAAWGVAGVVLFLAFEWLVVVGSANAVNITDGMDGLATGCMVISCLALVIFCYVAGRADWTRYLGVPYVSGGSEMAVLGGATCGACLGFLWFNAYPAQVFMGDSGSLPLGGVMAWMALVSKQELVLPLIASVFVADLGTSLVQRLYYKRTRQRIFTIAPIHHGLKTYGGVFTKHERGWHEVTVVVRFWILAACGAMASLALLKVR